MTSAGELWMFLQCSYKSVFSFDLLVLTYCLPILLLNTMHSFASMAFVWDMLKVDIMDSCLVVLF